MRFTKVKPSTSTMAPVKAVSAAASATMQATLIRRRVKRL